MRCVGFEVSGGKPTRKLYALSKPEIDWEPADSADNTLLVTARFPAPSGVCSAYRSAAYNFPDNVSTRVPLDSAAYATGALSLDSSNESVLCAQPGFIYVTHQIEFSGSAAGTSRRAFIYKNNTPASPVEVWGSTSDVPSAVTNRLTGGGLVSVATGDLIRFAAFQNSGGVLALGVSVFKTKLDAHYVAPPIGTTGKVTLFFYGG